MLFNKMSKKNILTERGFTLIEMLIVVVIIAILVAIMAPNFKSIFKASGTSMNANAKLVESAILQWQSDEGVSFQPIVDGSAPIDLSTSTSALGSGRDIVRLEQLKRAIKYAISEKASDPAVTPTSISDAFVTEFLQKKIYNIDPEIKQYVTTSGVRVSDFIVVANRNSTGESITITAPMVTTPAINYSGEIDGLVLSKKSIEDKDKTLYVGIVKVPKDVLPPN